jgi:hypothetical protein
MTLDDAGIEIALVWLKRTFYITHLKIKLHSTAKFFFPLSTIFKSSKSNYFIIECSLHFEATLLNKLT